MISHIRDVFAIVWNKSKINRWTVASDSVDLMVMINTRTKDQKQKTWFPKDLLCILPLVFVLHWTIVLDNFSVSKFRIFCYRMFPFIFLSDCKFYIVNIVRSISGPFLPLPPLSPRVAQSIGAFMWTGLWKLF